MKCQILFSGKNKKKYFKMSPAEILTKSTKQKKKKYAFQPLNISQNKNSITQSIFTEFAQKLIGSSKH